VKSTVEKMGRQTIQDKACATLKEELRSFINLESLNSNGEGNITLSYYDSSFTAHILYNKVYKYDISAPTAEWHNVQATQTKE
jgi:hypothetical protein